VRLSLDIIVMSQIPKGSKVHIPFDMLSYLFDFTVSDPPFNKNGIKCKNRSSKFKKLVTFCRDWLIDNLISQARVHV